MNHEKKEEKKNDDLALVESLIGPVHAVIFLVATCTPLFLLAVVLRIVPVPSPQRMTSDELFQFRRARHVELTVVCGASLLSWPTFKFLRGRKLYELQAGIDCAQEGKRRVQDGPWAPL